MRVHVHIVYTGASAYMCVHVHVCVCTCVCVCVCMCVCACVLCVRVCVVVMRGKTNSSLTKTPQGLDIFYRICDGKKTGSQRISNACMIIRVPHNQY